MQANQKENSCSHCIICLEEFIFQSPCRIIYKGFIDFFEQSEECQSEHYHFQPHATFQSEPIKNKDIQPSRYCLIRAKEHPGIINYPLMYKSQCNANGALCRTCLMKNADDDNLRCPCSAGQHPVYSKFYSYPSICMFIKKERKRIDGKLKTICQLFDHIDQLTPYICEWKQTIPSFIKAYRMFKKNEENIEWKPQTILLMEHSYEVFSGYFIQKQIQLRDRPFDNPIDNIDGGLCNYEGIKVIDKYLDKLPNYEDLKD